MSPDTKRFAGNARTVYQQNGYDRDQDPSTRSLCDLIVASDPFHARPLLHVELAYAVRYATGAL